MASTPRSAASNDEAARTRTVILDAVQSVIERDGVRGTSMRAVANEADVSVGLLSYHFDDKDTLIRETFRRATERLVDASLAAVDPTGSPIEQFSDFLRGSFADEFLDGDYLALRISFWAMAVTDPEVADLDVAFYRRYRDVAVGLLAACRTDLDDDHLHHLLDQIISITNGLWLDWARYRDRAQVDRTLARCLAWAGGSWDPAPPPTGG